MSKDKRERTGMVGVYKYVSKKRLHRNKPDVCWYILYRDPQGKVIREKVGWLSEGYTMARAQQIRAERTVAVSKGEPARRKVAPLFKEAGEKYLEWAAKNKAKGAVDDKSRYDNHLGPRFGEKRMDQITALDLEEMKTDLSERYAAATVAHVLKLFRMIWNRAVDWDLWRGESPTRKVKMPVPRNTRERFLSHQEAALLLEELKKRSVTVHDMALLSLSTGLRAGEIFALKGHDVDLKNKLIVVTDPKNKTRRAVFMTTEVKKILGSRMPKDTGEYIFTDQRHGGRIAEVSETFRLVADALFNQGITDRRQRVTFHSLRHTHASWLALQGESLLVIKEALGHKDLKMTQRYAHLADEARRRAAERLEKDFHKAAK